MSAEITDILDPFCIDEWADTVEGFGEQWDKLEEVIDDE